MMEDHQERQWIGGGGKGRGNGRGNGGPPGYAADDDVATIIRRQLGRPARGVVDVAVWCPHGAPAVVQTRPYLEDGEPFPTAFYLTCPSAGDRLAEAEAAGGVRRLREEVAGDPDLAAALEWLQEWYRAGRRRLAAPGPHCDDGAVFDAGIGGPTDVSSATCLHAYAGALLAALVNAVDTPDTLRDRWVQLLEQWGDLWCRDARCLGRGPRLRRRAAIDVGTNSVRLLVADLSVATSEAPAAPPAPVVRRAQVTRLGEGLAPGGGLAEGAMERTRAAVGRYVREARVLGASAVTVIGTSATRAAADGPEFMRQLGEELSVAAGVATGTMEARLAFFGATMDVPGDVALVDVGGGSTELVRWGGSDGLCARSLELGCVRDTERFVHSDPPLPDELRSLREHADSLLEPLAGEFAGAATLVAVGGTATTLAALSLGLERYNPDAVHHTMLSREQVRRQIDRLASMTPSERAALPTMQPGRADVIVAGAEILLRVMESMGYGLILVSERDLLDGAVAAGG